MNKFIRRRALISTGVVAAVAATAWYLLDSGFCFSQMRYLSDRELIVQAIRYNKDEMKIDGTDESIDAFLKQKPKCCNVVRRPSSRTALDVCLGFNVSEVLLNYEQKSPNFLLSRSTKAIFLSVRAEPCMSRNTGWLIPHF